VFAALNRGLARLEEILIAVLLVGMVLMTFSQVITRYGFNAGWGLVPWRRPRTCSAAC